MENIKQLKKKIKKLKSKIKDLKNSTEYWRKQYNNEVHAQWVKKHLM